jgi:sugar phosphate permease
MLSMLCLVGALEGADGVLLPCVFFALQRDLGLTLNNLAVMSMVQALSGNFSAPVWGMLADRGVMSRRSIIVLGCVLQGLITVALAGVDSLGLMLALRSFNGVMLASLRPIANGIVADVTSEANRGKVFAGVQLAMNLGTMVGTLVGTNLARRTVSGLQGWRVAFMIIGGASVLVGFITWAFMEEPPRKAGSEQVEKDCSEGGATKESRWQAFRSELGHLSVYLRMPSFAVLVIQGCFGTVPWNALGYKTLFFQLSGITDFQASLIDVFSQVAGSFGGILGGVIGDSLSRCSPHHGRPITAQISVLAGIPVAWFIFMAHPPASDAFVYYLLLMVVLGLTATWCGVGVNLPILSQIVKEDRRATIMAWEGTLETSCSTIFGNAMVGILAQNVFGYDLGAAKSSISEGNEENTKALGTALMLVSFFPWILCFCCYSFLHWSYPRDLKWLRDQDQKQEPGQAQKNAPAKDAASEVELQAVV